jgi:hypothetical protein
VRLSDRPRVSRLASEDVALPLELGDSPFAVDPLQIVVSGADPDDRTAPASEELAQRQPHGAQSQP